MYKQADGQTFENHPFKSVLRNERQERTVMTIWLLRLQELVCEQQISNFLIISDHASLVYNKLTFQEIKRSFLNTAMGKNINDPVLLTDNKPNVHHKTFQCSILYYIKCFHPQFVCNVFQVCCFSQKKTKKRHCPASVRHK